MVLFSIRNYSYVVRDRLRNSSKSILPQIKELIITSRTTVEVLKAKCVAIEKDFKQSREELKRCEDGLDVVKRDLQTLYTLRANEYLKPRQEQRIKHINEDENRLNELEREAMTAVSAARDREEELFESFKSSNDLLYQKSLVYANRFIILGVGVGLGTMTWRGYKWVRGPSTEKLRSSSHEVQGSYNEVAAMPASDHGRNAEQGGEREELNNDAIPNCKSLDQTQELRLKELQSSNRETQEELKNLSLKMNDYFHDRNSDNYSSSSTLLINHKVSVLLLGILGGITGATVAMVFSQR